MQRSLYFQACFGKVYIKSKILIKTLLFNLWKDGKSFKTVFREQVYHVSYKPKLGPNIDLQIKSTQAEEL